VIIGDTMPDMKIYVNSSLSSAYIAEKAIGIPHSLKAIADMDPFIEGADSRNIKISADDQMQSGSVIYSVTDFELNNTKKTRKYCTEDIGIDNIGILDTETPDKISKPINDIYAILSCFCDYGRAIELTSYFKDLAETELMIERIPKERLGRKRGNAKTKYRNIIVSSNQHEHPFDVQDHAKGKGPVLLRYYSLVSGGIELQEAKILPTTRDTVLVPFDCERLTF
jgi:hypothetical protein